MSNSNNDGERLLQVRREVASLSDEQILGITVAVILGVNPEEAEILANTLNKYEEEIVRLQDINARLRNKNRNYRTGMKALQRAHEATLHREKVAQDAFQQLKVVVEEGGVCVADGPYSPIRFNNDQRQTDAGWVVPTAKQSVEIS